MRVKIRVGLSANWRVGTGTISMQGYASFDLYETDWTIYCLVV
jgi:hypothetical protein